MIVFTLTVTAQSKTFDALEKENKTFKNDKCKIVYDKFKDTTSVTTGVAGLKTLGGTIVATFDFKGQTLSEPVKSFFVSITTFPFMEDSSLIFIADNERVNIGKAVDSNKRTKLSGIMSVHMQVYEFTPEQLEKFASSEKVEFQIGNIEMATTKDTSEKLKNLLTLSKIK